MQNSRHIIKKQTLEFQVTNQQVAGEVQDRFSHIYRTKVMTILEKVCKKYDVGNSIVRIENLDLNLGVLSAEKLETELPERIEALFDEELSQRIYSVKNQETSPFRKDEVITVESSLAESLRYYLRLGTLPWNSKITSSELKDSIVDLLIEEPATTAKIFKYELKNRNARKRLVFVLSDEKLNAVVSLLIPQKAIEFQCFYSAMLAIHNYQKFSGVNQTGFRNILWDYLLEKTLSGSATVTGTTTGSTTRSTTGSTTNQSGSEIQLLLQFLTRLNHSKATSKGEGTVRATLFKAVTVLQKKGYHWKSKTLLSFVAAEKVLLTKSIKPLSKAEPNIESGNERSNATEADQEQAKNLDDITSEAKVEKQEVIGGSGDKEEVVKKEGQRDKNKSTEKATTVNDEVQLKHQEADKKLKLKSESSVSESPQNRKSKDQTGTHSKEDKTPNWEESSKAESSTVKIESRQEIASSKKKVSDQEATTKEPCENRKQQSKSNPEPTFEEASTAIENGEKADVQQETEIKDEAITSEEGTSLKQSKNEPDGAFGKEQQKQNTEVTNDIKAKSEYQDRQKPAMGLEESSINTSKENKDSPRQQVHNDATKPSAELAELPSQKTSADLHTDKDSVRLADSSEVTKGIQSSEEVINTTEESPLVEGMNDEKEETQVNRGRREAGNQELNRSESVSGNLSETKDADPLANKQTSIDQKTEVTSKPVPQTPMEKDLSTSQKRGEDQFEKERLEKVMAREKALRKKRTQDRSGYPAQDLPVIGDSQKGDNSNTSIPWGFPTKALSEVYINNAGLVLIWPYLATLFKGLGWMGNNEFSTVEMQYKAVWFLQFLAAGDTEIAESELVLNKLLSGILAEDPVPVDVVLTAEEKEEAAHLLQVVIDSWTVLKGTSIDGFRGTFLMKEGLLKKEFNGWKLFVERSTMDILLEKLPWSYSVIKLPWIKEMIYVEW